MTKILKDLTVAAKNSTTLSLTSIASKAGAIAGALVKCRDAQANASDAIKAHDNEIAEARKGIATQKATINKAATSMLSTALKALAGVPAVTADEFKKLWSPAFQKAFAASELAPGTIAVYVSKMKSLVLAATRGMAPQDGEVWNAYCSRAAAFLQVKGVEGANTQKAGRPKGATAKDPKAPKGAGAPAAKGPDYSPLDHAAALVGDPKRAKTLVLILAEHRDAFYMWAAAELAKTGGK